MDYLLMIQYENGTGLDVGCATEQDVANNIIQAIRARREAEDELIKFTVSLI